ncbi:hypothetical protein FHX81_3916 [Saccharothrix saharensis]|uniref:Uncharacterized protein n=1 Tax=Saccharothrix saharensis TaxID=571190 RepID=A0A543JFD5_9PSEU|nr:hypothetical protein FHX81_3916 [Saccharothrix saharensis]
MSRLRMANTSSVRISGTDVPLRTAFATRRRAEGRGSW